jgi:hypothetical protein
LEKSDGSVKPMFLERKSFRQLCPEQGAEEIRDHIRQWNLSSTSILHNISTDSFPFELSRQRISEGSIFQKLISTTMTFQNFRKLLHNAIVTGAIQSWLANLPLGITEAD